MDNWWESFFDEDYIELWGSFHTTERTEAETEGIWKLLELRPGSRVLDAPCGYGRFSRRLAERGADVVGVDQSEALLARAEQVGGGLPVVPDCVISGTTFDILLRRPASMRHSTCSPPLDTARRTMTWRCSERCGKRCGRAAWCWWTPCIGTWWPFA